MADAQIIIGPLLGLLTILGGVYTALQARKANKESTVVTGYDSLVRNLQAEMATNASEMQAQYDRIVLLERKLDLFVRWGRAVIRWYESTTLPSEESSMPTPHSILGLNGKEDS